MEANEIKWSSAPEHKHDEHSSNRRIFLNTLFWGFILWILHYFWTIVFFFLLPKDMVQLAALPFEAAVTIWVLFKTFWVFHKKIQREQFMRYIGVGAIWTLMAVILDYIFIVRLFHSADYYESKVFLYYAMTFSIPVAVGWYKFKFAK